MPHPVDKKREIKKSKIFNQQFSSILLYFKQVTMMAFFTTESYKFALLKEREK